MKSKFFCVVTVLLITGAAFAREPERVKTRVFREYRVVGTGCVVEKFRLSRLSLPGGAAGIGRVRFFCETDRGKIRFKAWVTNTSGFGLSNVSLYTAKFTGKALMVEKVEDVLGKWVARTRYKAGFSSIGAGIGYSEVKPVLVKRGCKQEVGGYPVRGTTCPTLELERPHAPIAIGLSVNFVDYVHIWGASRAEVVTD